MELGGTTWIVTADGARARVFEERQRAGELRELPERRMALEDADRPNAHRHMATVHESGGHGRHGAGTREASDEAERRFLRRLATELETARARGAFDSLVLIAPPRALGHLKADLAPALAARLEATDPHERTGEDAAAVRQALRAARARA